MPRAPHVNHIKCCSQFPLNPLYNSTFCRGKNVKIINKGSNNRFFAHFVKSKKMLWSACSRWSPSLMRRNSARRLCTRPSLCQAVSTPCREGPYLLTSWDCPLRHAVSPCQVTSRRLRGRWWHGIVAVESSQCQHQGHTSPPAKLDRIIYCDFGFFVIEMPVKYYHSKFSNKIFVQFFLISPNKLCEKPWKFWTRPKSLMVAPRKRALIIDFF